MEAGASNFVDHKELMLCNQYTETTLRRHILYFSKYMKGVEVRSRYTVILHCIIMAQMIFAMLEDTM